jgi:hypothetical protein
MRRRVLVEAGHRCAIPTCRYPTTEIAHIIPYAEVREHEYHNLIALCPNCHTRYDRGEIDRKAMQLYKRKIAFLSDRYSKFELNVLDYLRSNGKVSIYGYLLVKNLVDDGLIVNAYTIATFDYTDGTKEVQEFVAALTDKGRAFLREWDSSENESLTY